MNPREARAPAMPARPDWPAPRVLASLYFPAEQRVRYAALCTLEGEIAASLAAGLDHQVAHLRLEWWRAECERCARGAAAHPLTRSLAASLAPEARPALAALTGLVDTATWDLAAATFDTRRELTAYCERWSAAFVEPLARATLPEASPATRALGCALKELELLNALATDARVGRLHLPLDELTHARVPAESLARPPWPEALAELLRERHRQLRAALAAAVAVLTPAEQSTLGGLVVWALLAGRHSRRAERALPGTLAPGEYHAPLDGWRAWRAARGAAAGRLRLKDP